MGFISQGEKNNKLTREIHSDLYAAVHIPVKNKEEHYKKIDSMMFSRMMTSDQTSHFTVAPLMALKIMISKDGFRDKYLMDHKKEIVADKIVGISEAYVDEIINLVENKSGKELAESLRPIVKNIVIKLDKELYGEG